MSPLTKAWGALAVLSAVSTLVAVTGIAAPLAGVIILLAAWAKSRLILLEYLELRGVSGWQGGALFGLALFCATLLVLYLIPVWVTP